MCLYFFRPWLQNPLSFRANNHVTESVTSVDAGWKTELWQREKFYINKAKCAVESSWNVMAHGDAREWKWRGNWRMEWVASTLLTTSEHGVSSITTADAHTSAASSLLNWPPRRFKWTRPFRRKTKSGFCACAITFQTQSTKWTVNELKVTRKFIVIHIPCNRVNMWYLMKQIVRSVINNRLIFLTPLLHVLASTRDVIKDKLLVITDYANCYIKYHIHGKKFWSKGCCSNWERINFIARNLSWVLHFMSNVIQYSNWLSYWVAKNYFT